MEAGSARQRENGGASRPADPISLLYVEDEAEAGGMVARMLALNYPELELYAAENGAAGLEIYRRHLPDLVMTDINMPVMDGLRMSREIRAITPEAHIIAITAHSDTTYLLSAIEIGIHNYVLKPINYPELFAVIDKILEQIALKRLVLEQNRRLAQSERQLAEAQRIAHLGSWQWDPAADFMIWSDELYRICGLPPGSIPASHPSFLGLFPPEEREEVARALGEAVARREPVAPRFLSVVRPDGLRRVLRLEAELLADGRQQSETMLGTCLDVTELKKAEEKIRSLTDQLERRVAQRTSLLQASVEELADFSYLVSHDLRAPVARLEGFCRALIEDCDNCPSAGCRHYAERAERVVRQVKEIIDAFNRLSRYPRCRLVLEDVDLSALVREIGARFARAEPDRRVEFAIDPGIVVRGDRRLLQTAMEQLVANAWKFTSKKERGRIEFGCGEQEGSLVYFLRDDGAGFNMKYADKLFKPFQTVHSPGEYGWNGAAVGLATVHSIILRHGGRVWAEGEPDRGASFYFTLEKDPEPGEFL